MDVEHLWFTTSPPSPTKAAAAEGRSRGGPPEGPRSDPQGATGGSGPPLGRTAERGGQHHFKWHWRPESRKGQRPRPPSPAGGGEDEDEAAGDPDWGGRGEGGRVRAGGGGGEDMVQTLTMMTDQMLYKLVKWCKSLPLFKNILVSLI
jgi:hypothetical protein